MRPAWLTRASALDRAAGRAVRAGLDAVPGAGAAAVTAAHVMSPVFRMAVAAMLVPRATRRAGAEALVGSVAAAHAARFLRGRIGRRRPGSRGEAGFPSRHAAASVAIARAVTRRHPRLGTAVWMLVLVGLVGRVHTGDHDPADLVAGAAVGTATDAGVERIARLPHARSTRYRQ